jgi:hypothetical protein
MEMGRVHLSPRVNKRFVANDDIPVSDGVVVGIKRHESAFLNFFPYASTGKQNQAVQGNILA